MRRNSCDGGQLQVASGLCRIRVFSAFCPTLSRRPLNHWAHGCDIYVDDNGPLDELDRNHNPCPALSSYKNAFGAGKRSIRNSHAPPNFDTRMEDIRMGFGSDTSGERQPESLDILVRQGRRRPVEANQPRNTRNLQHLQPIAQRKSHENVTRKQGQPELLSPVLPPSHGVIERQEVLDKSPLQLDANTFFVTRARVCRIPPCFEVFHGQVHFSLTISVRENYRRFHI